MKTNLVYDIIIYFCSFVFSNYFAACLSLYLPSKYLNTRTIKASGFIPNTIFKIIVHHSSEIYCPKGMISLIPIDVRTVAFVFDPLRRVYILLMILFTLSFFYSKKNTFVELFGFYLNQV